MFYENVQKGEYPSADELHRTLGTIPERSRRLGSHDPHHHVQSVTSNGEVIQAIDLLPQEMRLLYGYVPEELIVLSEYWNCRTYVHLFHLPERLKAPIEEYHFHFLRSDYSSDFTSIDECDLRLGDAIWFDIQSDTTLPPEYHVSVYMGESPQGMLVFSKNGTGPVSPFLLYLLQDVEKEYTIYGRIKKSYQRFVRRN